jgi:hypothetical protein
MVHMATAMEKKLRIVAFGVSGGRSLTRPLRDARRFPSTRTRETLSSHGGPHTERGVWLSRSNWTRAHDALGRPPISFFLHGGTPCRGLHVRR